MAVKREDCEGIAIVTVDGVVDEKMAREMREHLKQISETDTVYVIFDVEKTQFMSSTALGLLVAFSNEHQRKFGTGSVLIAGLTEHIKRTMEVLGLLDLFILTSDRESALKLCHNKGK
ncbi:MAG: STAS domain-containing protein [Planctomycetota bacterium]|nr:STAS domain-containing protein [Planctomycetota bacterium]